jgi:hypothetical protein
MLNMLYIKGHNTFIKVGQNNYLAKINFWALEKLACKIGLDHFISVAGFLLCYYLN